ncbi:MAG TPA: histidinol-phosphate transaminase [Gaiellales bacterium]|nr:histidinol-phosphate transaminase [Gaiellales bacterium]
MQARPALADLKPYEPGKPAAAVRRELGLDRVVKLASNEGPYGPFPAALAALTAALEDLNRYPEGGVELVERLAGRYCVEPGRIALGNGADSIIGLLSAAYLDPGDEVVMGWPSFPSYRLAAVRMGATPVPVALAPDGAYDLPAIAAAIGARTRIAYVCNPNNPTGGMVDRDALERFLELVPARVLVVVDEAYNEYVTDPDYPDAIAEHVRRRPNVCVLRTFSKIHGLAGLRIGYLTGPATVVADLAKVRNAFDVSEPAHVAALASLDDPDELARRRDENARLRPPLAAAIGELGRAVRPAVANFVCFHAGDAAGLAARLLAEGVVVRPLAAFGAPEWIRVTVGTADQNSEFVAALERALRPA